jgi:hypothetical protein
LQNLAIDEPIVYRIFSSDGRLIQEGKTNSGGSEILLQNHLPSENLGIGQATFNISGSKFALNFARYGRLIVFDFDNASGVLYNGLLDTIIEFEDEYGAGSGIAFSGNDRFMYVNA